MKLTNILCLGCALSLTVSASADFVDDEFNGTELGSQWTWDPGNTELGTSTYSISDGFITMTAAEGANQFVNGDGGAYIAQDMPDDEEWIIETRLFGYNPVAEGYGHRYNKAGIALHQDENNWIFIHFTSGDNGNTIDWFGLSQLDPTDPSTGANLYVDEWRGASVGYYENVYMRIRKTQDGYIGELSYDNISWFPVTPLLRNPASPDGSLDGTIRLYTSVSNPHEGRNPAPASFDYVRKIDVVSTPAPEFAEDEFDGGSTAEWTILPGRTNGYAYESNGVMNFHPGYTSTSGGSQLDSNDRKDGESALIAYQRAPESENYSIITKVTDTTHLLDASGWRGFGFRIWQNQLNWAGIKVRKAQHDAGDVANRYTLQQLLQIDNGTTRDNAGLFTTTSHEEQAPTHYRVDRNGDQFRVQYSTDGETWIPALVNKYAETNGWFTMTLQPEQPLLIQLFDYMPFAQSLGTVPQTQFEYVLLADDSNVSDWQLY